MRKIAPHSAKQGRLRPSFFLVGRAVLLALPALLSLSGAVQAQDAVYRCGQEYTNAPKDPSRCERLASQGVTVIPGLKPARTDPLAVPTLSAAPASAALNSAVLNNAVPNTTDAPQRQRDQQARTIVASELEKTRQRHAELVQTYRQGAPAPTEADGQSPQKYQERVASLKADIERHERDIDSLQRELARRPAP